MAKVRQLAGRGLELSALEPKVQGIIQKVRRQGDAALRRYAQRWDGLGAGEPIRVAEKEIQAAWRAANPEFRTSLLAAARNIRQFCEWQKPGDWQRTRDGITVGQMVRPLNSVACYVPGGRYPLVSTLLMTVIPARVAGVERICIASPKAHPQVLAAAGMLGVGEVYRVGGAQAIAALAYGTRSIEPVDKIVGPGNLYVTVAKKLVSFDCAIDFLAGPTEIVVLSSRGRAEFIAADLVAQAEHDPATLSVFITIRKSLADEVKRQVAHLARGNATARAALQQNGFILLAAIRRQAIDWANQIAPEHITVDEQDLSSIRNAGSVFVGDYSAQSAGDYASGPNHVLPTGGAARYRGGLSVLDFVKVISVQKLTKPGLRSIANVVQSLAETEGLQAHAESIRLRCSHA
ncbi:MAG: histidinol dehydrogenase [Terriglobales bacterium]